MPSIGSLLEALPQFEQSRLVASGYGVWVVWQKDLNKAVNNTLREYGALLISEESNQALWYCNTTEVFRALARLSVWSRVNSMPVTCEVVPLTFLIDYEMEHTVSLSPELDRQTADGASNFEVLIHPKLKSTVEKIHGLTTQNRGGVKGLAPIEWLDLVADQGLDYETAKKWYFIIKVLGSLSDKDTSDGWRELSTDMVELLRRLGLKYISDIEEGALYTPLDNIQLLKSFSSEMMNLIKELKADPHRKYWPVAMAAVSQDDNDFSTGLPKRIDLDWNRLAPDFPHVRLMDSILISDSFLMNETRYGTEAVSLDTWCTIAIKDDGAHIDHGSMQVILPHALVAVEGVPCFYCGHTNHKPSQCPSKQLQTPESTTWQELSKVNVKEFSDGFNQLDAAIDEEDYPTSMLALLHNRKNMEGLLSRAVFEINAPCQLRTLKIIWRTKSKDWAECMKQLSPPEGDFVWDALQRIENGDLVNAEVQIKEAQIKYPRSYQPHSLWGYWCLESGDLNQALFHWQEAERMSYTPLQQGFFSYLQGRLLEIDGNLKDAINQYKHSNSYLPTWIDPAYRQGVCMVKMGFTGQAMDVFSGLIDRDPHVFNRILVDPELERGRVQLMSSLWDRWSDINEQVNDVKSRVTELVDDINIRFNENHSYHEYSMDELERLKGLGEISNYVSYRLLLRGTKKFKQNLDSEVKREIKRIDANLDYQADRVREVQKEAAWFPFPKLLIEFNKDFNYCVDKINWIKTQQLTEPDKFRKALKLLDTIEERIDKLQGRLVTLRIIRDCTLFVLMLGRNFIWLEILGLGVALVTIPAIIYFTQGIEGSWIVDTIREQRWEFTKGLVIILSVVCLAVAAIKSGLSFDKRKRELFAQIDEEMRQAAPRRY